MMCEQVCAVGRAQASSVYNTSRISRKLGVPVWADGGVAATGHIVKVRQRLIYVAIVGVAIVGVGIVGVYFLGLGIHH